jgi:hypothetical protein
MARVIREGRDTSCNRKFSGCLEMKEDENIEVLRLLWEKTQSSPRLKENLFNYICEESFDRFKN